MRKFFENIILKGEETSFEGVRGYPEEILIDWLDTKTISLHGKILVDKGIPMVEELRGLVFEEDVDSANVLLLKVIKAMYRYDIPASRRGWLSKKTVKSNDVFRKYPLKYYDMVQLYNHSPWLKEKLMLDIYIYSKLATGMIWKDWTDSSLKKDRYLLHKPEKFKPFTVVFKRKYIWGEDN